MSSLTLNPSLCFLLVLLLSCTAGTFLLSSRTTPIELDDDAETEMMNMHEEWGIKHNRVYDDLGEKDRRFAIFKENVKLVNAHNSVEGRKYDLEINKFADLTNEEFKVMYTGGLPGPILARPNSTTALREYHAEIMEINPDDVPASKNWRRLSAVGSVKNQGSCGSCWAFAAVSAMESIHQINTGELLDLSEQELLDCVSSTDDCHSGHAYKAFDWIVQNGGLNSEQSYPYKHKKGKCRKDKSSISVSAIRGFKRVPANNEMALRVAVSMQPVVVHINGDSPHFKYYGGGIFEGDDCTTNLNHAVTVVGYDVAEDGTKYWIVKNSWGDWWGEQGYVKMRRDVEAEEGICGLAMAGVFPVI